ncbi:ATP-binding protein [Streptomyces sp. NPDC015220]|uniref:ATP-binding protein n=1 Tax=Streptomyces sp. NPDC015220 TaxID=3364947 RepID=UPI0036FE9285
MPTGTTTASDGPRRSTEPPVAADIPQAPSLTAQFASTPRGVRLARRLAERSMGEWGYPPASDTSGAVALIVGELAANAVRHGRVPGRDFGLRIRLDPAAGVVRIEVADATAEQPPAVPPSSSPDEESGRGLLLVDTLADRWGSASRHPVGKTVWAEVSTHPPTD